MRKARVWGCSLYGVKRQNGDIYNVYTTKEILRMDSESEYCEFEGSVGWVEAEEGWYPMFTQVYMDDIEWLGDNEE